MNKYFKRSEFACECEYNCNKKTVDKELLDVVTDVRVYFNKPVNINSGHRCGQHNSDVGGVDNSYHKDGTAADIVVKDIYSHDVYEYLDNKYKNKYGIGKYHTFTHIDIREIKARW